MLREDNENIFRSLYDFNDFKVKLGDNVFETCVIFEVHGLKNNNRLGLHLLNIKIYYKDFEMLTRKNKTDAVGTKLDQLLLSDNRMCSLL